MISTLNLGRVFRIRLRLHYTWIITFFLTIAIVVTQFSEAVPLWQRMLLGVAAGLLFLLAITIRELILNFFTVIKGLSVRRATLFIFGGVSQISKEVTLPSFDLLLAVAGLLSNLLITLIFWGIYLVLLKAGSVLIAGLTQWLAYIFFLLTLFHFVPGFPLDGGRVLRAILWKATDNYERATRITSWIGWGIGWLCIIGGIVLLVNTGQWLTGLVLILVGWVLQSAASRSRRLAVLHEALRDITARDIMSRECPLIDRQLNLKQLVQDCVLVTGQRYFVIADGDKLQGVVTTRDIKRIPRRHWASTFVDAIMTPANEIETAHSQQTAASLLEQMDDFGIDHMPVLENDAVIGLVTRDSLNRFGKTRAELRI